MATSSGPDALAAFRGLSHLNFVGDPEGRAAGAPLLRSLAFRRLASTTFLGILSPRFARLPGHPLRTRKTARLVRDGTRADHSVGVAQLIFRAVDRLTMSGRARRYAVAWALCHDISTLPLSHTGEAAFSPSLGLDARELRTAMIKGENVVPSRFRLTAALREAQIDVDVLLSLFDRSGSALESDLRALHNLLHSPITPDSLEGIHRSAISVGYKAPAPKEIIDAVARDLFEPAVVKREDVPKVIEFWVAKGRVYRFYINSERAIRFESRWSDALRAAFQDFDLAQIMDAHEDALVTRVLAMRLARYRGLNRYKPPLDYRLGRLVKRDKNYPVQHLGDVLTKGSMHE